MPTERVTIKLESGLAAAVRAAVEAGDLNVSAWLADAARRRLADRELAAVVADWETAHGSFSSAELEVARSRLAS